MIAASEASKKVEAPWSDLFKRKNRPFLLMAFFQQMTGMNIVIFYAPESFNSIGFGSNASLAPALITGAVNICATLVAIYFVDKVGRRKLFFEGGIQMFILQVAVVGLIGSKFGFSGVETTEISKLFGIFVVLIICGFVCGFTWSWRPLGWLVPSEIFPLEIRSSAYPIVVAVNMLMTFVLAQIFLAMLCHLKFILFLVFALFTAAMTVFIYFFLSETKGIPIKEVHKVWEEHTLWKKLR